MRCAPRLVLATFVLCLLAPRAHAITFGEPDGDDHPYVGAIILDFRDLGRDDYEYGEYCSSTLIHPRVVLTAAHCTLGLEALGYPSADLDLYVSFDPEPVSDTDPTTIPADWREVVAIHTHPGYHENPGGAWIGTADPHDIAALVLAEPVEGIEPAALPELGFLDALRSDLGRGPDAADFLAVGYGGQITYPPPVVVYYDTRWRAWMGYQTLLRAWLVTSQNPHRGDGGTCYGDSGGPVFWVDGAGAHTLVAITSWGDVPCIAEGLYYRTDIPGSVDFIAGVLDAVSGL